ncbi:hypothetical protein HUN08_17940 [Gordonia sp. X0973]|uniref:hypothetical protein n=1 Tax=Gordonia sp. X0973 TaxID=2742602 RepID=UPI000F53D699|nr:hypothetical protein [Gordonia sp. X0973]QKT08880.1 hypothetical protein HUN08_17940 [Gordonia sp. X0973]
MMSVPGAASNDPRWTAPNIDAAVPSAAAPGQDWQQVSNAPRTAPGHRPGDQPPTVQGIGRLAGVDLPTSLPAPEGPPVAAGLAAHKPGGVPLRPLRTMDLLAGSFTALLSNLGITALAWVVVWTPGLILAPVAARFGDQAGLIVGSIVAFVTPVVLAGLLAAPLHGRVIGRPMGFTVAVEQIGRRLGALAAVDVVGLLVLAAPAVLLGLVAVALMKALVSSALLVILMPVVLGIPVFVYLMLAGPILMVQAVVGIEPQPLRLAVPRALQLYGRHLVRQIGATALMALILATVSFALFMFPAFFFGFAATAMMPITVAIVSPLVAGFAVLCYVDARIRSEAYDVELLAQEATA